MFRTMAVIRSLSRENANVGPILDCVTILHDKNGDHVVAEYKGVRYTAILNGFVCRYYVDDLYGKLPNQHKCPMCGAELPELEEEG